MLNGPCGHGRLIRLGVGRLALFAHVGSLQFGSFRGELVLQHGEVAFALQDAALQLTAGDA